MASDGVRIRCLGLNLSERSFQLLFKAATADTAATVASRRASARVNAWSALSVLDNPILSYPILWCFSNKGEKLVCAISRKYIFV